MRAIVTGGSGFVGTWLIAHLQETGDEVQAPATDITDGAAIADELAAWPPDAIYHLAGQADVGRSWQDPRDTFTVNALGTLNVLEAARHLDRPPRILLVSSADVYGVVGPADLPIGEDHPLRPSSPYGASKVAAEVLGEQSWRGWGLPVIRARAFNHIGPGQGSGFVVSAIAEQIAEAERTGAATIGVGDLSTRRDFTDVRDVVRAYRLLIEHGQAGEAYNVCRGVDVAIADLAAHLIAQAVSEITTSVEPGRMRPVEVPVLRGDPRRIRAATGWEPTVELGETLRDVLEWWRRQPT